MSQAVTNDAEPARATGPFRSLQIRNYRLYFWGQMSSMAGTWMQSVALAWLVLELTNSAAQVGGIIGAQFLPILLFGSLVGVFLDRHDRRRVVLTAEVVLAIQATILAILVLTDVAQIWMLYVLALAQGAANSVEQPGRQALLAELVDDANLSNAVGLNGALFQISRIVGPALAAVLIQTVGIGFCFAVNAVSFLGIITAVLMIRPAEMFLRPRAPAGRNQLRQGFAYVAHHRLLRVLLLSTLAIGIFQMGANAVLPLMAKDIFGGDGGTYGLMGTLMGVGASIAAISVASLRRPSTHLIWALTASIGVVFLAAALAPTLGIELVVMVFFGAATLGQNVAVLGRIQLGTAEFMRGRVIAMYFVVAVGSAAIGGPLAGAMAEWWGPRVTLAIGGCTAFVVLGAWYVHDKLYPPEDAEPAPVRHELLDV